jgi:pimeloyl-ACP methyl ester carboxylesterase
LPIINDARRLEHLLGLEEAFTVIYWDQRGTGLSSPSLRKNSHQFEISVTRMVDDTVTLLELLRDRFGGKTFVAGFSFGATFAAYAAVQRPELVAALVAAGMDIDIPAAENNAYAFAVDAARQRGNRRAIRQLEAIGPPPHTTMRQFTTRARWVANFGGVTTNANFSSLLRELVLSLVRSPDYSPADVIRTLRGMSASQAALLPQLATTDLVRTMPRLDVPLVMAQGRLDQVAPGGAAQRFHDSLTAPSKQLVWFESSAHTPHLEEPAKFRDLLMNVRASQLTST